VSLRDLVGKNKKLTSLKFDDGSTALFVASIKGYLEMVRFFIEMRVDVNQTDKNRIAPL